MKQRIYIDISVVGGLQPKLGTIKKPKIDILWDLNLLIKRKNNERKETPGGNTQS